jgi:xanthine dehydrogenase molybdopterin-binding subunit B
MRFSQVKHLAAEAHVSGAATFLADIGVPQGTVHAQFVTSTRAHANIIGLHSTACYEIPVQKHLFYWAIYATQPEYLPRQARNKNIEKR